MERIPADLPHPDRRVGGALASARWLSRILDEAFQIPGTKFRFGLDPLIGLIPVIGDLLGSLASLFIIVQGFRLRVPHIIKARMMLNVLIDVLVGAVPLLGDIFDFAWKSNSLNLALLEKHAFTGAKAGLSDWAFVVGIVMAGLIVAAVPIILLILAFTQLQGWIHGPSIKSI